MVMLSLPLIAQHQVIGSLVLGRPHMTEEKSLSTDEFKLMLGIAQQLGLSLENARLYQEARERESMLGELLHQAVGAQEAERQRIARELHDATGQSLTAIALGLRGVESMLSRDPTVAGEQIKELSSFGSQALGELRRIIADLRPSQLDDLGLVAALQWYIQEFKKRYGLPTELVITGERRRLPAEYETVLFRITQEALTNVARHAQATQATVKLEIYPAQVWITIQDDGCGFEPKKVLHNNRPPTGWGLLGIQERTLLLGGQCEITSELGRGTRIQIKVPLVLETDHVQDTLVVS
jgi:two-component system sensor histidine kinase UhpB